MKNYIGKIEERNGDMEYDAQYLFQTAGNPEEYADMVAKGWRGNMTDLQEEFDEDRGSYWCDHTLISTAGYKEVSQEDFDVLKKYIPVL
jgi:hypothetical protein